MKSLYELNCPREKEFNFFLNTIDLLNSIFVSDKCEDILEFYELFNTREELIQWLKKRPKGQVTIHEIDGEKDIIVVIPTKDFYGKFAKECREHIFNGFHMIFVESGPDPYFTYAYSSNVGIKKALEYNPKWIIVTNDDILSSDTSEKLKEEILKDENKTKWLLLPKNSNQSGKLYSIVEFNIFGRLISRILLHIRNLVLKYINRNFLTIRYLNDKFRNNYFIRPVKKNDFLRILFKEIYRYYNFEAFAIFSADYIMRKFPIFDETFINAHCDQFASMDKNLQNHIGWINYNVNGIGGVSLGYNLQRRLRSIAATSYLNYLIEKEHLF